jgi:hypothetical protein
LRLIRAIKKVTFLFETHRETVRQLAEENTSLIDHMKQNEKDTIDVVAYLRKIDADKQMEVMKRPPRRIVHL